MLTILAATILWLTSTCSLPPLNLAPRFCRINGPVPGGGWLLYFGSVLCFRGALPRMGAISEDDAPGKRSSFFVRFHSLSNPRFVSSEQCFTGTIPSMNHVHFKERTPVDSEHVVPARNNCLRCFDPRHWRGNLTPAPTQPILLHVFLGSCFPSCGSNSADPPCVPSGRPVFRGIRPERHNLICKVTELNLFSTLKKH